LRPAARDYKLVEPLRTVQRIRAILADVGLGAYENHWRSIGGGLHSCVLNLEGLEDLVVYGKGRNREYALASAYGELIERIQNLKLFFTKTGVPDQQVLAAFPDSTVLKDLPELYAANEPACRPEIERLCRLLGMPDSRPVLCAPFYDVRNRKNVILPYLPMLDSSGSNGMCAGNDPAEALVQGLCEVFEREVLKRIFTGEEVPPDVPLSRVQESSCAQQMQSLEELGISVQVKDCSCGQDFPVVGALLVNRNTGRYRFKLGAHPVFDFALERALSEVFQGMAEWGLRSMGEEVSFSRQALDGPSKDLPPEANEGMRCAHFLAQLRTGSGRIPNVVFSGQPTHAYREESLFARSGSYAEDLRCFQSLLDRDHLSLYIRDVSFLGFPSYYVFIPGYSSVFSRWPWQVKSRKEIIAEHAERRKTGTGLADIMAGLSRSSAEERNELREYIELHLRAPEGDLRDRRLWLEMIYNFHVPDDRIVHAEYLLALLQYRSGDLRGAFASIDAAIERHEIRRSEHPLYHILRDAFFLLSQGRQPPALRSALGRYHRQPDLAAALQLLDGGEALLQRIPVPSYADYRDRGGLERVFSIVRAAARNNAIRPDRIAPLFA
jgi:ribosomal protein S12 methylthiotransferase accessory factor